MKQPFRVQKFREASLATIHRMNEIIDDYAERCESTRVRKAIGASVKKGK